MTDDWSPYGVTHHADADAVTANALVGERVGPSLANAGTGSSPATFSTAPYAPPKAKVPPTDNHCIAVTARGTLCRTFKVAGSDYCVFHQGRA